ncbi:MAG TPA: sugar phosphate isomerase/epimerase family protein [Tepidisphaeraceae bacterium]|nr:sugar phosphate isomerase/epimerase family protein [Tepidisphaeraceae bacterium]
MKFGAHIYLWIDRWSNDHLGLLERARKLGLECLEIAVGDDVTLDIPQTRRRAESLHLDLVLSPGAAWPMACDISDDDPANRRQGLEWHRRWIEAAGQVGAVAYTGAIYGHPGRVQKRHPPADELPRTAENLHLLAEHARCAGVRLVLEPMSHFRTHLLNTPEQAMRLVKLADHPNLQILLDTYHLVTEVRDYAAAVREVRPVLWGIHACENDRGVPGNGLIPWEALSTALHQTAFDGHILLESYNSSLGDFAVQRGMFHNVCPEGDAFARNGLAFLRLQLQQTRQANDKPR